MAQKGISRVMVRMRRRVSEKYWAQVVPGPKTWRTREGVAATSERTGVFPLVLALGVPWRRAGPANAR